MPSPTLVIAETVDDAWLKVAAEVAVEERRPMLLQIAFDSPFLFERNPLIRSVIDGELLRKRLPTCRATSFTIFPREVRQRRSELTCNEFCRLCVDRLLPRMRARNSLNRYGTYFERMMDFERDPLRPGQLTAIVEAMKGRKRPRESMLQMSIYDPKRDQTGQPVRGFPCLQQVSISYGDGRSFSLNALYPVQYVFDRAYGNYLGLCHLGEFIAQETNWTFDSLMLLVISPRLGSIGKREIRELIAQTQVEINS